MQKCSVPAARRLKCDWVTQRVRLPARHLDSAIPLLPEACTLKPSPTTLKAPKMSSLGKLNAQFGSYLGCRKTHISY